MKTVQNAHNHLIGACADKVCRDATCVHAVAQGPNGRFYITMGHAGFNTPANNSQGYDTAGDAEATMRKHLLRRKVSKLARTNWKEPTKDAPMKCPNCDCTIVDTAEALNNEGYCNECAYECWGEGEAI